MYDEERHVLEKKMRKIDECVVEKIGALDNSE